jgi:RimJ/RimL family protein N-acetyltransferase
MFERSPKLVGRRVALRPVRPADYDLLYRMELSEALGQRWRHRGWTPSPERFVQSLWEGVTAQFMVVDKSTNEPVGLVAGYGLDWRDATCSLAITAFPSHIGAGWILEGAELFLDYLFMLFPLRKVYAETVAGNYETFTAGAGLVFHEEGRLRDHDFYDGKYWDKVTLAVYRDEWQTRYERIRARSASTGEELDDFPTFSRHIADAVDRPADTLFEHTRLVADWHLDSLGLMIALTATEALGAVVNDAVPWEELTLGDLHAAYQAGSPRA